MTQPALKKERLYVLDTNVLMHDPTALFRFHEHDIYLPMVVLEELDNHKTGPSEVARNVRQTNRFLVEMLANRTHEEIRKGLSIPEYINGKTHKPSGRIYLQTEMLNQEVSGLLPGGKNDNSILAVCLGLRSLFKDRSVVLVSKDINLRIKASILGIHSEDYYNDHVIDDINLLHKGFVDLPADFWDKHGKDVQSWHESGHTFYRLQGPMVETWHPNECLYLDGQTPFQGIVRHIENDVATIEFVKDFHDQHHSIWGITARNREQNFALNLLLDPNIDFVSLTGTAGTGKTLLALAAGLHQVLEHRIYKEIIMTRVTVPVGEDIGFLPGTEEEKMTPWMGAMMDNLEVLQGESRDDKEWERRATTDLIAHRIKIRSLNFMRGRTFLQRYIIIDEAQNLTSKQIKTLITRAGPGTKLVCLGDIRQIDTPYLTEHTSGLTYAVDRFRHWEHAGHITLMRGERSRLTDFAAEHL